MFLENPEADWLFLTTKDSDELLFFD